MPDLSENGLVPLAGTGVLWRDGWPREQVDEVGVRSALYPHRDSRGFFYLEVENWPLESVSPEVRKQNIAKLRRVAEIAHEVAPHMHLGFYGLLPGIAYWQLMQHDHSYREWQATNKATEALAANIDIVFPSLYTFYVDIEGWKSVARQTLIEARRYQKPVVPFIWPEFHDSTELRGQEVPAAYWRAELEICYELADGVVLWGGWTPAPTVKTTMVQRRWNPSAEWWAETKRFMVTHSSKEAGVASGNLTKKPYHSVP
jgi:hypothetical protein